MTHRILFMGGCHVTGYRIAAAQAFPVVLSSQLDRDLVGQVAHVTIARLPAHLAQMTAIAPTQVVFQLGNYECSACGWTLLQRLLPTVFTKSNKSVSSPSVTVESEEVRNEPTSFGLTYSLRVAGAGFLNAVLWCGTPSYRRNIQVLNTCMRQYPATTFVFLSPFPCLPAADNAMRRFGGWMLRRRLARLPNCHWVDTHALLPTDARFFVDPWHLNECGHHRVVRGLADCLTAVESQENSLYSTKSEWGSLTKREKIS